LRENHQISVSLGHSCYLLVQYEDAMEVLEAGINRLPHQPMHYVYLTVVLIELERDAETQAMGAKFQALTLGLTLPRLEERWPYPPGREMERFLQGLRKAGLPG